MEVQQRTIMSWNESLRLKVSQNESLVEKNGESKAIGDVISYDQSKICNSVTEIAWMISNTLI